MIYQRTGFWNFRHDCKWDKLEEPQHTHLIIEALNDRETEVQINADGSYILYGRNDALLTLPQLITTRLLLCFYRFAYLN